MGSDTANTQYPISSFGHLLPNIVRFARLLRDLGMDVTSTQIFDFVAALDVIDLRRREDVQESARAIFVSRREQLALFDAAFALFWRDRSSAHMPPANLGDPPRRRQRAQEQDRPMARTGAPDRRRQDDEPILDRVLSYSDIELLRHKDFARMNDDELDQVWQLMQTFSWRPSLRWTRRRQPARHGDQLDPRRMLRANLRYGGESLRLAYRRRKQKQRRLVVLCDISGSMERYTRVLLQFLYALRQRLKQVDVFVFSTHLTRITRHLQRRTIDEAVGQAVRAVDDWAGGTRIGAALHTFNFDWGRRVLGQGVVVLIISDGWDRGDPAWLGAEMERLHLSCHRLIWLNPLLGAPDYQPLTGGIQAALPHVDDFLPVHNLVSLEQLAHVLETLN